MPPSLAALDLRPGSAAYPLAGPDGQRRQLDRLTRLLCALDRPVMLWHGPVPVSGRETPDGSFAHALAAAARPRRTVLVASADLAARLAGLPAAPARPTSLPAPLPALVTEHRAHLGLADSAVAAVAVLTGWPASVPGDWLGPLAADPAVVALAVHLQPVPAPVALRLLRRRLSSLLSTAAVDQATGEVGDPAVAAATTAAAELADGVARGARALLRAQVLLGVRGADRAGVVSALGRLRGLLASGVATLGTAVFEQGPGWAALQPGGPPLPWPWRLLDAAAIAAALPHPVGAPTEPGGLLVGVDPRSGTPLSVARSRAPNPVRVVVGTSGAGKSFAAKLEACRWHAAGGEVVVVDPEGEFDPLVRALGGATLLPGRDGGLDPVGIATGPGLAAGQGLALLADLATALAPEPLEALDLALLDRALERVRHGGRAPSMAALLAALDSCAARRPFTSSALPGRLAALAQGALGELFAPSPLLAEPPRALAVDLRDLPARVRPAGMACVLGWAWSRSLAAERPRLLVLDEAHLLLDDPQAADLLAQFARRSRKYRVAVDVVTQRLSDLLACPAGQAVLANAATLLLLGCADHEREVVAAGLGLTPAEAELLRPGVAGRGLLLSGGRRDPVQVLASAEEAPLAASGPRR